MPKRHFARRGDTALLEDTSPQLGGDLDLNSFDITGTGDLTITGDFALTGAMTATSFGGITEANLLDKTADENVTGDWVFSSTKFKTADTERTSADTGTTLTDDPHLFGWTLQPGSIYRVTGYIQLNSASTTPDYKHRFQFSQTPVDSTITYITVDTASVVEADTTQMPTTLVLPAATASKCIQITAFIDTHATLASILDYQWAQNVSDAAITRIHAGSWIKVERMGDS